MGILNFFRKLFGGGKKKIKYTHHVKSKKKAEKKVKHRPIKKKRHDKIIKTKIKKPIFRKKPKEEKNLTKQKKRENELKEKAEKPKQTEKKPKMKYGIPKHHEHEAELKIAERRSDIEEFYTPHTKGKVSLKVMEKGIPEFEEGQAKHQFFFRKKPLESALSKKAEPLKKEEPKLSKSQIEKKATLDRITKILKSKQDQNLIVTNLDMILEVVNTLGKVKIDQVAESLKVKEEEAEELAKILEENSLIEIHYPPFGKIEFKKKKAEKVKTD